jgi:hypothetical protein
MPETNAGPSLADLLAATSEPSTANTEAATPPEAPPTGEATTTEPAQPVAYRMEDAPAPTPNDEECEAARAKMKTSQQRIDKQRERALVPLQNTASKAQVSFENCMTSGKTCTDNGSKFKRLLEQRDATAAKVSAVLDKIGAQEAALFPLSQTIDRVCQ